MNGSYLVVFATILATTAAANEKQTAQQELDEYNNYMERSLCSRMPDEIPTVCLDTFRAEIAERCIVDRQEWSCEDFKRLSANRIFRYGKLANEKIEVRDDGKIYRK